MKTKSRGARKEKPTTNPKLNQWKKLDCYLVEIALNRKLAFWNPRGLMKNGKLKHKKIGNCVVKSVHEAVRRWKDVFANICTTTK